MKNYLEVLSVQLFDHLLRIRKVCRVPDEFSVVSIPAGRREVSAQVDESITWQFLLAECACDPLNFIRSGERSMRLQIPQRPKRWHFRVSGQSRVFGHHLRRFTRSDNKDVER